MSPSCVLRIAMLSSLLSLGACSPADDADRPPVDSPYDDDDAGAEPSPEPYDGGAGIDAESHASDSGHVAPGDAGFDASPAVPCKKRIEAFFANYAYTDEASLQAASDNAGNCWSLRVHNRGAKTLPYTFRRCSGDGPVIDNPLAAPPMPGGVPDLKSFFFSFDDTSPAHGSSDATRLGQCANGMPPDSGYELMAYLSGGWKVVSHAKVKVYFAELYDSGQGDDTDQYRSVWLNSAVRKNNPKAAPMFSLVATSPTPKELRARVTSLCSTVPSGGYLGFYVGQGIAFDGARLDAVTAALRACTVGP